MLFSILIPTLENRLETFDELHGQLTFQIARHHLQDEVEILYLRDGGQMPTGTKRNQLMTMARGEFIAFIDDDDEVDEKYISLICDALRQHPDIDCIGIRGKVTFCGTHPRQFIHSLRYQTYSNRGGVYYRPPYQLNPIRRSIALQYAFQDTHHSEDTSWAMALKRAGALKKEFFIDQDLYHYRCRRPWQLQWISDLTEWLGPFLGLGLTNRLRIKKWLRSLYYCRQP
jgi:hypothetical protein